MLLEIVAGVVLLLAAISLVVQVLAGEAAARRATQHKLFAIELLSNILEKQTALPGNQVTPQSVSQITLPPEAAELLPNAKLSASLIPGEDSDKSQRLTLELTWHDLSGAPSKPVRLSAWIYPPITAEAVP